MQTDVTSFLPVKRAVTAAAMDALAVAHARTVDARDGLAGLCGTRLVSGARLRAAHARHAASLGSMLIEAGGAVRGERATVALESLSALLDGTDSDLTALTAHLRQGERRLLSAFDTALACDLPCTMLARLRAMRAEIAELIAQTRAAD